MSLSTWRASTGAATLVLLFCAGSAGIAAADETPGDGTPDGQTTEINDRQGWEDDTDQPIRVFGPTRCDQGSTWYTITSKKAYHVPSKWNGTSYKDGPGGSMTVSVTKSGTIAVEIGGSVEFSTNAIIAKAKATVSTKVTTSVSIATGHTYTRDIPRNKYGHLQYGSWGYKVKWKKYRLNASNCNGIELGSGTATIPTSETGWKFRETSS
ncbi:hypothetical protein ACIPJS_13070 [Streptomyces sp. NPDC086783]|uniref:hypothetical protein n=1 Tax=Streptomyces sp. NPDC086783 TaxID=3365758 RepID=UPI0038047507